MAASTSSVLTNARDYRAVVQVVRALSHSSQLYRQRAVNRKRRERARSTVHNWVQKADLEPQAGRDPDKIALDETVVKVNGERLWLYAAVDPDRAENWLLALAWAWNRLI